MEGPVSLFVISDDVYLPKSLQECEYNQERGGK